MKNNYQTHLWVLMVFCHWFDRRARARSGIFYPNIYLNFVYSIKEVKI